MNPILIHLGRSADGCAYELSPESRQRLRNEPGASPVRRVFISYDTRFDFEAVHGPIEWQVAIMLTGLGRERLTALGGVAMYDPRDQTTTPLERPSAA